MEDSHNLDNDDIQDTACEDQQSEKSDHSSENVEPEQQSLYDVLGVKPDAPVDEIRERYRLLAREVHPDLNPTHHDIALFIKVRRAYEILKDKKKRAEYDKTLGIYHSKINGGGFLRETSHQILRDKLESGEDEDEEKSKILPQAAYFKKEKETKTFFDKILTFFNKEEAEEEGPKLEYLKKKKQDIAKNQDTNHPQLKQREYQFSIDPLESLLGTERIIVLNEGFGEQNTIKVKIPKGINDKALLKVFHPERGTISIRVVFHAHTYVSRNGLNVTLLVPISENESRSQVGLDVYTCQSKYHVNIPAGSLKPILLHGEGLTNKKTDTTGDFIIQPVIGNEKAAIDRISILKLLEPLHHHD